MEMLGSQLVSSAQSLLDKCTYMVATHLDIVESFLGLPSLIGERIFTVACQTDRFISDQEYSMQAVRLFTDAYGEEFLSSLDVSGEHLGLNYCLEQILMCKDLVELDLSYCGLGDEHEMLAQIQHLHRLKVLALKGNAVTNVGVQKMTAPYRMFKRGPTCLEMLDLRENLVSRQCLKYLMKFESLHTVLLTEPRNERKKIPATITNNPDHFDCWTLLEHGISDISIQTEGWAKVLINKWVMEARLKSLKSRPVPKTGMFSIRKCPVIESSNQRSITNASMIQSCCDIAAKRVDMTKHKSDLGKKVAAYIGDVEEESMEELYKIYKTEEICHEGKSILKQLDFCDNETIVKTYNTHSGKFGHKNTVKQGRILPECAIRKNQNSIKANTDSLSKSQNEVHRKANTCNSIRHFMIRKNAKENTLRQNSPNPGTVHTSSLSLSYQNGIDQQTRTDNINCEMKSDDHNSTSRILASSSLKINCTSLQDLKLANKKSRKRKIVIKKSCDANTGLITERTFENLTVASRSDNESEKTDTDSLLDDDNFQKSKRFKSSFLQYLY